jgi:hypothetical protein
MQNLHDKGVDLFRHQQGLDTSTTAGKATFQSVEISGSTASGPQQYMPSAWVGIASAPGSAFTVYEGE